MRAPAVFQPLQRAPHGRAERSRGFTLVELMVAMTGGLFLSIVVFALSRDTSRFYQRESRIANATLAGVAGFERLSNDIARAGHLSTANIATDPRVCNRPQANWPEALRSLRALVIDTNATSTTNTEIAAAGLKPHGIIISGALTTPEVLLTNAVSSPSGGAWQITLNLATPSAARLGLDPASTASAKNKDVLESVFLSAGQGRIVRLRDHGMDQYAVVAGVSTSPGEAVVTLAESPALVRLVRGGVQCGVHDLGEGMALSVVDLVRYDLRSMVSDATYASLFKAAGLGTGGSGSALPYEGKRAELVRVELNAAGIEIAATREIISEYAVDLRVDAWGATNASSPTLVPITVAVDQNYALTHLLRGVHVRFSTRSREADREADISGTGGSGTDLYRIPLGAGKTGPYARVRTLQSDIALRNLESSNW
jgi:type II secretory pathway pseudopilin PulG